jgi:hypothetical protein
VKLCVKIKRHAHKNYGFTESEKVEERLFSSKWYVRKIGKE